MTVEDATKALEPSQDSAELTTLVSTLRSLARKGQDHREALGALRAKIDATASKGRLGDALALGEALLELSQDEPARKCFDRCIDGGYEGGCPSCPGHPRGPFR